MQNTQQREDGIESDKENAALLVAVAEYDDKFEIAKTNNEEESKPAVKIEYTNSEDDFVALLGNGAASLHKMLNTVDTHTTAAFEATIDESTSMTPPTSPRSVDLFSQYATRKSSRGKKGNPMATMKAKGPGRPKGKSFR